MKPFQILIMVIFALMAISSFYFWLQANKIGWKYRHQWPDIRSALTPAERKAANRYLRKGMLCFIGGIVIIILLFFLQGTGKLFPKY